MPKQRHLVGEEKENAVNILSMKSNKKLLQSHIKSAVGKMLFLMKKKNTAKGGNDFNEIIKEMKKYPSKYLYNNATLGNCHKRKFSAQQYSILALKQ